MYKLLKSLAVLMTLALLLMLIPVIQVSAETITIDGDASDWSGISTIATAGGQSVTSLKAVDDGTYLYFCIQGQQHGLQL